jgi:hypothetical protein
MVYRGMVAATALAGLFIVYGFARMMTGTGKIQRF